jgi:hypothetical protein
MDESSHSIAEGLKVTCTETSAAVTSETKSKTNLAEGVLIDFVAPMEAKSSVLSVSASENTHRNSILDEPIDVIEEGESILYLLLNWLVCKVCQLQWLCV